MLVIITVLLKAGYLIFDSEKSTLGDYRQSKANALEATTEKFNGLILGSSRVIGVENLKLNNYHFFNYGVIQGVPGDFAPFIDHFKQKHELQTLIIGLDFHGSGSKGIYGDVNPWKSSETYITKSQTEGSLLTQFQSLYDFNRFQRLINRKILKGGDDQYQLDKPKINKEWNFKFKDVYETAFTNYEYNNNLSDVYGKIKESAGNAQIIPYITPVGAPIIEMVRDKQLEKEYGMFVRQAVATFGKVYCFMKSSEMTQNPQLFMDENHLHKDQMLAKIYEPLLTGAILDPSICTVLTAENVESYLQQQPLGKQ